MSSMNKVWIIGRCTRDPDLRSTTAGKPVCNVSLAVDRSIKNIDSGEWTKKTSFIDVAVWGARGESFAKFHQRGSLASIEGYIEMDEWVDKRTQEKRSTLKVVCEDWTFVGGATEKADDGGPF